MSKPIVIMAPNNSNNERKTKQRWLKEEIELFLDSIIKELHGIQGKFEKPTAAIFYEKIRLNTPGLDWINHSSMKNKFNYLKKAYTKAINWRNRTGSGALDPSETIEDRLNLICPYFDKMDKILSSKRNVNLPPILDTMDGEEDTAMDEGETESVEAIETLDEEYLDYLPENFPSVDEQLPSTSSQFPSTSSQLPSTSAKRSFSPELNEVKPKSKRQRTNQTGPAFALLQMQEKRMEADTYKTDQQTALKQDKLAFEREKWNAKLELKQTEIEMKKSELAQRLQIEENIAKEKIASEERLKRYELELAYQKY